MSDETLSDETRAYRIVDDRRSLRFTVTDSDGWQDLEIAVSILEPGYLMIRQGGSDPILLNRDQANQVAHLALIVRHGPQPFMFPTEPRPCESCGEIIHSPDTCEAAEEDPTVLA